MRFHVELEDGTLPDTTQDGAIAGSRYKPSILCAVCSTAGVWGMIKTRNWQFLFLAHGFDGE